MVLYAVQQKDYLKLYVCLLILFLSLIAWSQLVT